MRPISMSALTFKDLSTELTQAIETQLDTPSGTKARCTLGREKVMVLVEYPSETSQSAPLADSTLDWLEQSLRQQFDTVGLPEEAADLTETGEAVAVQLFLKHHSEPKPFTARSFVWKVADGFNDLFGTPTDDSDSVTEIPLPIFQDETGSLSSPEANVEADIEANEANIEDAFLPISTVENLDSEDFSLPEEEPTVDLDNSDLDASDLDASDLDLPTIDLPIAYAEGSNPSDEGFFDFEAGNVFSPSAATDNELAADFENALDRSAAQLVGDETDAELAIADDMFSELLDSELLASENATAEPTQHSNVGTWQPLPTQPSGLSQEATQTAANVEASAPELTGDLSKAAVRLRDPFDGDRPIDIGKNDTSSDLPSSNKTNDQPFIEDASDENPVKNWTADFSNLTTDELDPGEDIFALDDDAAEPGEDIFETSEDETDEDEADEDETGAEIGFDAYGSDEYDAEGLGTYELDTSEYAADEDETAEDDELPEEGYQLEQASEEDTSYESVALIDEREVQQQREQWQQQTKGNPWFFAGAIGFFVIGLLGFVLTRPCSFGACPRIETAQAEGERALSDLTLEANAEAVAAAKQQLNRSVRSLQPIPFWSPHYSEANAVLPQFESQLTALDRVSAAQAQAYAAALASQNPPHSSTKWEEIAQQWRGAIATLENVPTDNQVRRLADRKLTEYRANLSTIKVRIDAESQAETSLLTAQKAATLAAATAKQASSLEGWESALQSWESAVEQIDQIPLGTLAYEEAQGLQAEYRQQMETVRDRALQERNASRNLSKAQQLASDAERVASEDQWTVAVQTWTAAVKQVQDIAPGTSAHTKAQPLVSFYQQSLKKADSNRQVSQRFQPVEPSFYTACGATTVQRCTYSVRGGNVRLNLLENYDRAINQSITPPDQRSEVTLDSGVVTQSNQLLKEITLLSTQGNFPIELYDAKGEFLARYRPDLNGFVKDQKSET